MAESATSYYDTPERAERAALVGHLLSNTELVPCVCGPTGAGKSRFAEQLVQVLADQAQVVLLDAAIAGDLPQAVADAVGAPGATWPAGVVDAAGDRSLVIILDQAERLSEPQCKALAEVQEFGARLVFVQADDTPPPGGQWRAQRIDLPPFSIAQAQEFLFLAGIVSVPAWSDAQWQRVWRQTGGQPGPLLAVAQAGGGQSVATAHAWKWVLGGGAALLVVAVLSQQDRINAWITPPVPKTAVAPPVSPADVPAPSSETAGTNSIPIPPLPAVEQPPSAPGDAKKPEPAQAPAPGMARDSAPAEILATPQLDSDLRPSAPPAPLAPPHADAPPETGGDRSDRVRMQPPPELSGTERTGAESPVEPAAGPAPQGGNGGAAPTLPAEPPPPPSTGQVAPAAKPVAPSVVPQAQAQNLAWLRSRPPGHYTLQLLGARDPAAVDAYIRLHGLTGKYVVFSRDLGGKPWYSLLYGDYPTLDAGRRAQAALPAAVRTKDVWLRSFRSVLKQL